MGKQYENMLNEYIKFIREEISYSLYNYTHGFCYYKTAELKEYLLFVN